LSTFSSCAWPVRRRRQIRPLSFTYQRNTNPGERWVMAKRTRQFHLTAFLDLRFPDICFFSHNAAALRRPPPCSCRISDRFNRTIRKDEKQPFALSAFIPALERRMQKLRPQPPHVGGPQSMSCECSRVTNLKAPFSHLPRLFLPSFPIPLGLPLHWPDFPCPVIAIQPP
jgi:hypothetical protein